MGEYIPRFFVPHRGTSSNNETTSFLHALAENYDLLKVVQRPLYSDDHSGQMVLKHDVLPSAPYHDLSALFTTF